MPSIRDELASYGLLPIVYDYVRMGVRRDYVLEVPAEDEAAVDFLRQVCDDMDGDELFGRILQFSPIIAGRIEAAEKRPSHPRKSVPTSRASGPSSGPTRSSLCWATPSVPMGSGSICAKLVALAHGSSSGVRRVRKS